MTGRGAGRPQVGRWATLEAAKLRIRRAGEGDVDFLVELVNEDSVEPFLAASRARNPEGVLDEVQASAASPKESGVFVIEVADDGGWTRAGMMAFSIANQGNRIASLGGLAIHPDFRGHKLSDQAASIFQRHLIFDLDFHRLQLECYAFNERAIRHAERSGFVREGVKRKAYRRHGEWVDAIMFALIREDLEP